MLLDSISRRARRLVCSVNVIDSAGTTMAHRHIMSYLRESAMGDANKTVQFDTNQTFFITTKRLSSLGQTNAFRNVFGLFKRAFPLPARIVEGIEVLSSSPFADSSAPSSFASIFEPSSMPRDIGGTLCTGTDQHCCLGVEQSPRLDDNDALWQRYTDLTPVAAVSACAGATRPPLPLAHASHSRCACDCSHRRTLLPPLARACAP